MRDEAAREQYREPSDKWKAWDKFLEAQTNTGFKQSSWYTSFRGARGAEHFGMVLSDRGSVVGGAVVFKRSFTPDKCYYYIPEGPVFLDSESTAGQEQVFHGIMEFIDGKRQNEQQAVSHLRIDPRWEHVPSFVRGFQEAGNYCYSELPRDTQWIDLNLSESA